MLPSTPPAPCPRCALPLPLRPPLLALHFDCCVSPSCRCFVQVEEPELEADEEDGEDDRENWRSSGEEEELDYDEEDSDEEEELLDELLASKAPA